MGKNGKYRGMNKQMSLSSLSDELAQVWMRKREFVTQMNRIIPRGEWVKIVKLYYKGKAA